MKIASNNMLSVACSTHSKMRLRGTVRRLLQEGAADSVGEKVRIMPTQGVWGLQANTVASCSPWSSAEPTTQYSNLKNISDGVDRRDTLSTGTGDRKSVV